MMLDRLIKSLYRLCLNVRNSAVACCFFSFVSFFLTWWPVRWSTYSNNTKPQQTQDLLLQLSFHQEIDSFCFLLEGSFVLTDQTTESGTYVYVCCWVGASNHKALDEILSTFLTYSRYHNHWLIDWLTGLHHMWMNLLSFFFVAWHLATLVDDSLPHSPRIENDPLTERQASVHSQSNNSTKRDTSHLTNVPS